MLQQILLIPAFHRSMKQMSEFRKQFKGRDFLVHPSTLSREEQIKLMDAHSEQIIQGEEVI